MTTHWKPGVNGQPSPTETVVALVGGELLAIAPLGYTVILDPDLMADGYVPHQVKPPLTRVWGDDDPANPIATVQLAFADEQAAREALPDLWINPDAVVAP